MDLHNRGLRETSGTTRLKNLGRSRSSIKCIMQIEAEALGKIFQISRISKRVSEIVGCQQVSYVSRFFICASLEAHVLYMRISM